MAKPTQSTSSTDRSAHQLQLNKRTIKDKLRSWRSPGVMALKIAVAATISGVIAQWLQWEYPFYAVIAAIIVMGSTSGSTLSLSIGRIIGTIIGAVAGAVFSLTLGSNPWSLGISVFLTIFLSSVWKLNEAAKLAGYVSAIVSTGEQFAVVEYS